MIELSQIEKDEIYALKKSGGWQILLREINSKRNNLLIKISNYNPAGNIMNLNIEDIRYHQGRILELKQLASLPDEMLKDREKKGV